MKTKFTRITSLMAVCFLFCSFGLSAQNHSRRAVDSPNHLIKENPLPLTNPTRGLTSPVYIGTEVDGIYKTTMNNLTQWTHIYQPDGDIDIQSMEYVNGNIYAIYVEYIDGWGDGEPFPFPGLMKIDPVTDDVVIVEDLIGSDGTGLAWNPVDDQVYVTTWYNELFRIDLITGETTEIARVDTVYTIAIDNDGICYAQAITKKARAPFGTLDLTTGVFTEITSREGNHNDEVTYMQNLEIDRETNELYWNKRIIRDGSEINTMEKVDKTTGETTLLATLPDYPASFAIISEMSSIPVPVNFTITKNAGCNFTISWEAPAGVDNPTFNLYKDNVAVLTGTTQLSYTADLSDVHNWCVQTKVGDELSSKICKTNEACTIGIGEFSKEKVMVGPNPASDMVRITGDNIQKVEIYNVTGQLMQTITNKVNTINVSSYSNGIYYFKLYQNNGEPIHKKIIVNR